jgi:hypothetical protein
LSRKLILFIISLGLLLLSLGAGCLGKIDYKGLKSAASKLCNATRFENPATI